MQDIANICQYELIVKQLYMSYVDAVEDAIKCTFNNLNRSFIFSGEYDEIKTFNKLKEEARFIALKGEGEGCPYIVTRGKKKGQRCGEAPGWAALLGSNNPYCDKHRGKHEEVALDNEQEQRVSDFAQQRIMASRTEKLDKEFLRYTESKVAKNTTVEAHKKVFESALEKRNKVLATMNNPALTEILMTNFEQFKIANDVNPLLRHCETQVESLTAERNRVKTLTIVELREYVKGKIQFVQFEEPPSKHRPLWRVREQLERYFNLVPDSEIIPDAGEEKLKKVLQSMREIQGCLRQIA